MSTKAAQEKSARKPYTAEEKARHALQTKARKMAADNLIAENKDRYEALLLDAKKHYGVEDRTTRLDPTEKASRLVAKMSAEDLAALLAAAEAQVAQAEAA